jgi:hypothetical protein
VKPSAFLPNPANGETSVFRLHRERPTEELRGFALRELGSSRRVRGVAFVKASDVRAVDLEVEACEPPPLHANIAGWPWRKEDREFGKAERKEKALLLAQRAGPPSDSQIFDVSSSFFHTRHGREHDRKRLVSESAILGEIPPVDGDDRGFGVDFGQHHQRGARRIHPNGLAY